MSKIVNWGDHYVSMSRLHCELFSGFLIVCQINKLQILIPH